ncbi:hypothetical protein [Gracilibacillus thailandensis]|nr:hypothetical protein [Gracilibacillus thailandensis]
MGKGCDYMNSLYENSLEILNLSDVEIVQKEEGKSYTALLLCLRTQLKYKTSNDYDDEDNNSKEISFYYLVQIVDGKVNDTALSEDNSNEFWLDIKNQLSEDEVLSLKNKLKGIFNDYLKGRELIK